MFLAIFLLPLVAAIPLKPSLQNYILEIEDGTLKNVQASGDTLPELDLSGMGLSALEKTSLDNLSELKSLNLANNSLKTLPDFVFANLTSLEYLSLAENNISNVQNFFVGLDKLRVLNISHNPIVHLRTGHLFGLTKSVDISVEGNIFWSISTGVFTSSFLKDEERLKILEREKTAENPEERNKEKEEVNTVKRDTKAALKLQGNTKRVKELKKDQKLKFCISDGVVNSLEVLKEEEEQSLPEGCSKLSVVQEDYLVVLQNRSIKSFQAGWYKLHDLPIATLDLSRNEITEITKEILNDLPEDLIYVDLHANKIGRIPSQVIENSHLKMLNLKGNLIEDIEENVLQKTNLTGLYVGDNQLKNLNFVASLPSTLTELILPGNQITSIPDDAFSNLPHLLFLNLENNQIGRLQNNAFRGLDSLDALCIAKNSLTEIEPKAFKGLKKLRTLVLYHNSISELQKGTFSDLKSMYNLNLSWNKFRRITKNTFADLPKSVDSLYLDGNEIDTLDEDSFVDGPQHSLSLTKNKLSSITHGAFNLRTLKDLNLVNNTLTTIDGDSFEGLPQLRNLWLSTNNITEIRKGSCKNLGSLNVLDISKNPFERLENGALHGLTTARGTFLYIYTNQLKVIQGGVFDDV